MFLRPSAQFFEGIVVHEVLVPSYLPRLTLLPRPLPRVRLPLDVLDRQNAIEGRGDPGRSGGCIALFGNGSVAVRKITIKYSRSEVVVVVVVVIGTTGARFVVVYNVVLLLDWARRRGNNGSRRTVVAALYLGSMVIVVGVVVGVTMATTLLVVVAVPVTARPPLLLLQGRVRHCRCSCRGVYHLVAATTAAPSIVVGGITVVAGAMAGAGAGKTGGPGGGRPPPAGCKGC